MPKLGRFNLEGGIVLLPELIALLLGAHALHRGLHRRDRALRASRPCRAGRRRRRAALGLRPWQIQRLVVIPQAMRVVIPPLTNQYLNLTKNSSLAVAIGYPDLVSVFAGTVLNQTNQAVEVILITMGVYLGDQPSDRARHELVQRAHGAGGAVRMAPRARGTRIDWLKANLFSSWGNTALTLIALAIIWIVVDALPRLGGFQRGVLRRRRRRLQQAGRRRLLAVHRAQVRALHVRPLSRTPSAGAST